MSASQNAAAGFEQHFGGQPTGIVFTPGRVNLIGEHVDYNGGMVLPMPISVGTAIAWRPRDDGRVHVVALDFENATDVFTLGETLGNEPVDWRSYVRGTAACLGERGLPAGGADIAIAGSIPRGSGLSSSASLCVAVGRALASAAGAELDALALSLAAQEAEHRHAGVKCGIMDQLAVAAGEAGSAILIDCRALHTQIVRLPAEWAVMIVQSGVSRGLVEGHYNQRRADCETAAQALGIACLREATLSQVEIGLSDPVVQARAGHVVSEIERTARAVDAIAARDIAALGRLFAASHASMRDDFAITVPAIDRLVSALEQAIGPAGGARMTGGGFGGAVVAIMPSSQVERVSQSIRQNYRTPNGHAPLVMTEICAG